jgi:hypothetical protein
MKANMGDLKMTVPDALMTANMGDLEMTAI